MPVDVPSEAATVIPPARVVVVRAIAVAVDKILFTLFLFIVSTPFLFFLHKAGLYQSTIKFSFPWKNHPFTEPVYIPFTKYF